MAVGPQHARVELVADLDQVGRSRVALQARADRIGVIVHGLTQLVWAEAGPRGGLCLVTWIRPGVGVVEVNEHSEPIALRAPCHTHDLGFVVVTVRGVDPNAKPHVTAAVVLKDPERGALALLSVPIDVVVIAAQIFGFFETRDVGAEHRQARSPWHELDVIEVGPLPRRSVGV